MSKTYAVMKFEPYEGEHYAFGGTLNEVKAWVKTLKWSEVQQCTLYSEDAPDIEELWRE